MNLKAAVACLVLLPSFSQASEVIERHFSWLGDGTAGCGVAVVKGKELAYEGYFGQANLRYHVPVDHRTRFNIGSVSKHMTAALIHSLEREGRLSLQDTLKTHYPDGPEWFADVTLDHMIHHLGGLGDYLNKDRTALLNAVTQHQAHAPGALWRQYPADFIFEPVENHLKAMKQPGSNPGEIFEYSNTAYLLLAAIAQNATKQPFDELMQQYLFEPLGMDNTTIRQNHQPELEWSAQGYDWQMVRPPRFLPTYPMLETYGAGGVMTTVRDFALWAANLMQPTPETTHWQAMFQPELIVSKSLPAIDSRSLPIIEFFQYDSGHNINGLNYLTKDGAAFFGHDGQSSDGMTSWFWFEPTQQIAYFQSCNFNYLRWPEHKAVLAEFSYETTAMRK